MLPPHFYVDWSADVERSFTEIWVSADTDLRRRLTDAADYLDQMLAITPMELGHPTESEPALRTYVTIRFGKLVRVTFRVFAAEKSVLVVHLSIER